MLTMGCPLRLGCLPWESPRYQGTRLLRKKPIPPLRRRWTVGGCWGHAISCHIFYRRHQLKDSQWSQWNQETGMNISISGCHIGLFWVRNAYFCWRKIGSINIVWWKLWEPVHYTDYTHPFHKLNMGVSKNRGTWRWMVYSGKSY